MQMLWCWRCKSEMPMLDEIEFAEVRTVHQQCITATKEFRRGSGLPMDHASVKERMLPLLLLYEQMTGYVETNPNAVMHHRLSQYGPPCKRCGKPLRTPLAKVCGACMFPVERDDSASE